MKLIILVGHGTGNGCGRAVGIRLGGATASLWTRGVEAANRIRIDSSAPVSSRRSREAEADVAFAIRAEIDAGHAADPPARDQVLAPSPTKSSHGRGRLSAARRIDREKGVERALGRRAAQNAAGVLRECPRRTDRAAPGARSGTPQCTPAIPRARRFRHTARPTRRCSRCRRGPSSSDRAARVATAT